MRYMLMHKLDEAAPEWDPTPEFIAKMDAFIQNDIGEGVLLAGEGVFKSERGARVRKAKAGGITAVDGPFTEAKEVVGGFVIVDVPGRAEAVEIARKFAALFEEAEVEVRQVVEQGDLPA